MLTSTEVSGKTFRVALRGYSEQEVDAFLDRVVKTLWEWQADRQGELQAKDVERQTFRVSLRGYAEEEVDKFLDEIVSTLQEYKRREIEGLTPQTSVPAESAADGTPEAPEPSTPPPDVPIPIPAEPSEPVVTEPLVAPSPPAVEPTPTVTRLIVTRIAEKGGRPYTVLLDDKPIGKVSPGATQQFEIPNGMHWVTVKTRKQESNKLVIEPHEGDQITLTCGLVSGDRIDDLGRKIEGIILDMAE